MQDKVRATNTEKNQILMDAIDLYPGESTYRKKCPRCKQAGSFSLTRDDQSGCILYKCFRAKCGIEGSVQSTLYDTGEKVVQFRQGRRKSDRTSKLFTANPFAGTVSNLPEPVKKYLTKKFEFENVDFEVNNIKYDVTHKRLVLPIYDYYTRRIGCCLKKLPESTFGGPKAINHWELDDPIRLHFPPSIVEDSDIIVATEGIIDAIKISSLLPSVALLGVDMNEKQASFLASHYNRLLLLLDPDAMSSMQKIKGKYSTLFDDISIRYLDKDPKDTSYERLEQVLLF